MIRMTTTECAMRAPGGARVRTTMDILRLEEAVRDLDEGTGTEADVIATLRDELRGAGYTA